jgi:AAA family ATP:ADP antiporter
MEPSENEQIEQTGIKPPGIGYKILRLITVVHPGEALTAFLLTLNVFLLLAAYYILKPIRDALVVEEYGAEIKLYLNAVAAVLLIFVVKIFSSIASRFPRQKLITWVTLFFISNIVIFYILHLSGVGPGTMGIIFFVWVGIFNLVVIAQFWGFANDLYTEDEGKRLFPLIAFGAVMGGFAGGIITNWLVVPLGKFQLLLVSGGILGICILFAWIIHRREIKRIEVKVSKASQEEKQKIEEHEKPLEKGGAFQLLFKSRYLLYIGFFVLLMNFINTNGVYILDKVGEIAAATAIEEELDKVGEIAAATAIEEEFMTRFYASFYNIQNGFAIFVQLFVVSRVFKWFGVRVAIFILPVLVLGGYFFVSLGAALVLVKWVKAIENGADYSLVNTARHSLFLITTREEKYKAQAVTKTFFHRAGDVLAALLVFSCITFLAFFSVENVAMVNVVLVIIWIIICILIFKEHKKLSAKKAEPNVEYMETG